jgi:hypothetical protein
VFHKQIFKLASKKIKTITDEIPAIFAGINLGYLLTVEM